MTVHVMRGILPISQSSFLADYPLVGSADPHGNCGSFFTVGCLNISEHKGMNLDGVNMEGKVYLQRHRISCHRPLCPICWTDWANREKDKATTRLRAFILKGRSLKPIHVTVSVPNSDWSLSLQKMREKVYRALKMVHCFGGMLIYHPKRQVKLTGTWYFSPHFHILGYGWLVDIRQQYIHSGYIVKNIGIRKTIEGTIYYQLSHCGIDGKHHAVTWFGGLSYAKLHVKYEEKEDSKVCPICGKRLERLMFIGKGKSDFLEIEGSFFGDDCDWVSMPKKYSGDDL